MPAMGTGTSNISTKKPADGHTSIEERNSFLREISPWIEIHSKNETIGNPVPGFDKAWTKFSSGYGEYDVFTLYGGGR